MFKFIQKRAYLQSVAFNTVKEIDQNQVRKTIQILETRNELWENFDLAPNTLCASGLNRHTSHIFKGGVDRSDGVKTDGIHVFRVRIVRSMTMFDAFFAGCSTAEFAAKITLKGVLYRPGCTRSSLDIELLEELDCPAAHAATEHDISILLLDEARYLAGLVAGVKGVINHFYRFNFLTFHLDEGKEGAAPKVMGHRAF